MHHKNLLSLAAMSAAFAVGTASAVTVSIGEASLTGDQLTVPVTVDEAGDVELLIGAKGPNANPRDDMKTAQTVSLGIGTQNVTVQIPVGAKIAYAAKAGGAVSETREITATDTSEYVWVNNAKGLWSDPANWTRKDTASDGYANIGYPAYSTGAIRFNGNQTAEVTLDADYGKFGDIYIDNPKLNLTIHGDGHTLETGNAHCADSVSLTLDHARLPIGGTFAIQNNSTLKLVNGSYISVIWEFHVNGKNALLYVGKDSEVSVDTWYHFCLCGENARVELDDGYLHSHYILIAQHSTAGVPYGFVFKGSNPRLDPKFSIRLIKELEDNINMDFFVPRGGYSRAPAYLVEGSDGNLFFGKDVHDTKVNINVAEQSPFYQDLDVIDTCLVDSARWSQGVNPELVNLSEMADPNDDNLYYTYYDEAKTNPNRIWAHLTGKGIPPNLSVLDSETTATTDRSTGTVKIEGSVSSLCDTAATKVGVYVGATGPNADPASAMELVATLDVTEVGTFSYTYHGVLGSRIAYKFVCYCEDTSLEKTWPCGETIVAKTTLDDNVRYQWIANREGLWSDPANWTIDGGTPADGLERLGYPGCGALAGFYGSQTDVVYVDGVYPLQEIILGWGGADLTFVATVAGAALDTENLRDGQYDNVKVTLDGVSLPRVNAYHVKNNSSLVMTNSCRFADTKCSISTTWEVSCEGQNAYMYVGSNCTVNVAERKYWEGYRLGLAGDGAEIVIDDGVINCFATFKINESSNWTGKSPKGVTFKGNNPRLNINQYMKTYADTGVGPVFEFEIPEGGYLSTPIKHTSKYDRKFGELGDSSWLKNIIRVSAKSPYLGVRTKFTQQLVDWTCEGTSYAVDMNGLVLDSMPGSDKSSIYFTPETGDQKSGISAYCYGKDGFCVIVR